MPGNSGNARDNRQRGNAAQLLEKYKSMARDAQLAGDRVQTEYYLQFADHYFRVLEENRSRFEEQNPRRGRGRDDDDSDDDGDDMMIDGDQDDSDEGDDEGRQQPRRDQQRERNQDRGDRPERSERQDRSQRQDRGERQERPDRGDRTDRARLERPRRERPVADNESGDEQRSPLNVLPPSIPVSQDDEDAAPSPRRRTRKPRDEGNSEDMAPAA
jgi:hypothetical protein